MAERETEHRRIVVETPTTHREVERTEAVHHHPDRSGISGAALAAIVVGVIALATLIILFVMNQQQTANETAATQQQPSTTIVQQPAAQQPPVIIEQQAPATQPPVIINNPAGGSAPATGNGDALIIGVYENNEVYTDVGRLGKERAERLSEELAKSDITLDSTKSWTFWKVGNSKLDLSQVDPSAIAEAVRWALDRPMVVLPVAN